MYGTDMDISEKKLLSLSAMANRLRHHSIVATAAAGSGHPTSCMSCAELVAGLFFHFLRYDLKHPKSVHNDRFVLSKGHAAPILWAALAEAGAFPVAKLETLRRIDSDLEGHPTPRNPWIDVATGSLGQGLSAGAGMALASWMNKVNNHIFVLLGDGETAEGSVWEAAALARRYRLFNLTAIIDVNGFGQSEQTIYGHDVQSYADRFGAFGWHTRVIDGHRMEEVLDAYAEAVSHEEGPTAIIARTIKGKGVAHLEGSTNPHGKPVSEEEVERALREVGGHDPVEGLRLAIPEIPPGGRVKPASPAPVSWPPPGYSIGEEVATRKAYGQALHKLGGLNEEVVVLDGEVKNSTYAELFAQEFPARYTECFIAEQNMVGMAMGMSALGKVPFVSSFACFLTRAADQIRMAGISRLNVKFCGSHAGISIGEDGPSQMGLEDLALFRALPRATVLYPADAVATERCVALAAEQEGIAYIRTGRPATPVIYPPEQEFSIGGSVVLKRSRNDKATVLTAGITIHEALKAAAILEKEGIMLRVIDLYSIKPIDETTIEEAARETRVIITVEDHYADGGLGDAVLGALAGQRVDFFRKLAVLDVPRSGPGDKLMDTFGISAGWIILAVKEAFLMKSARKSA